jgi:hypothetical protein
LLAVAVVVLVAVAKEAAVVLEVIRQTYLEQPMVAVKHLVLS